MSLVGYTHTPMPPTSSSSLRNYRNNPKIRFIIGNKSYNPENGPPEKNDKVNFNHKYTQYQNGIITAVKDGNKYDITGDDSEQYENVNINRIRAPVKGGRIKTRQNRKQNRKSRRRNRK